MNWMYSVLFFLDSTLHGADDATHTTMSYLYTFFAQSNIWRKHSDFLRKFFSSYLITQILNLEQFNQLSNSCSIIQGKAGSKD